MTSRQRAASTPRPHAAQTRASNSLTCAGAHVAGQGKRHEMLRDGWRQAAQRRVDGGASGAPGPHLGGAAPRSSSGCDHARIIAGADSNVGAACRPHKLTRACIPHARSSSLDCRAADMRPAAGQGLPPSCLRDCRLRDRPWEAVPWLRFCQRLQRSCNVTILHSFGAGQPVPALGPAAPIVHLALGGPALNRPLIGTDREPTPSQIVQHPYGAPLRQPKHRPTRQPLAELRRTIQTPDDFAAGQGNAGRSRGHGAGR